MDEGDFRAIQVLLRENGLALGLARYHPEAFGSWYVEVVAAPPLRIVWDGRDGWLLVQVKTSEVFNGSDVWRDIWIEKECSQQTPERAVATVLAHCGAA
jgi:hypothetical protein